MAPQEPLTGTGLRTPRAAAIAGILFAVLLGLALVLILLSAPPDPSQADAWLSDPARRATFAVALDLVPFAGIAFLWFIGVVRDRIGHAKTGSSHRSSSAAACCSSPCCSSGPPSPAG